jgi:GABA permease
VENPFRSEAAAFRFLLITIGAFALIVAASLINTWLGVVVLLLLTAAAIWAYVRRRAPRPPREHLEHVGRPEQRRVLVVANETVGGAELLSAMGDRALAERTQFLVVCPALNSRVKTWMSDENESAEARLETCLRRLESVGIQATGMVGDLDPLLAIEDVVHTFRPDEIVISTQPEGRSHWLERGVVNEARERYDVPVTHVVVDSDAQGR